MSDAPNPNTAHEELPDVAMFWRWVGKAVRRYIGWILVGAGALCILIGYLGVSRESLVAKQLPYLISGGIAGLALIAVGTFYLATEELRRDSGRLDRLESMVGQLHAVLLSRADARVADQAEQSTNGGATGGPLVALPDARRYHRPSCPMTLGKSQVREVSVTSIGRRRLRPCDLCEPPEVGAMSGASAGQAG